MTRRLFVLSLCAFAVSAVVTAWSFTADDAGAAPPAPSTSWVAAAFPVAQAGFAKQARI
jgi:hypothetical protein